MIEDCQVSEEGSGTVIQLSLVGLAVGVLKVLEWPEGCRYGCMRHG